MSMIARKKGFRRGRKGMRLNKKQEYQVKRLIKTNQELKYHNSITAVTAVSTTPVMFQITDIAQGNTDTSRNGDRLKLSRMSIRGSMVYGDSSNYLRLIFFQWRPNTNPTAAQILLPGTTGFPDVYSHYNHDQRQQFRILYDKTHTLTSYLNIGIPVNTTGPLTSISTRYFSFSRRIKWQQLQYTGGTTVGTNQVWYLTVSDSSVVTHPAIEFAVKFLYTDS